MNHSKVKQKVSKIAAKSKKKLKKLVTNKRRGYSKLAVKHSVRGAFSSNNDYDDEELEMEVDLNYDMNASYNYVDDPNNTFNPCTSQLPHDTSHPTNIHIQNPPMHIKHTHIPSVTQTYIDDINDRGLSQKTEYFVVPFYLMVCILSVLTTALLCIHEISENLGMSILISCSFIGAVAGIYGVYSWGVFDDVLQYLVKQNELYRDNIDRLNSVGEVLQNDVDDINGSVDYLKRDGNSLELGMQQYNKLKCELQEILDNHIGNDKENNAHHERLSDLLDEFNEQCETLNTIIEDNEKAHLLSIFYSVKLYDYGMKNCLDRKQYSQFLAHCNKNTREKFINVGGFEALDTDNTGYIDVDEFERVVYKVLNIQVQESQHLLNSSIMIQQRL